MLHFCNKPMLLACMPKCDMCYGTCNYNNVPVLLLGFFFMKIKKTLLH